MNAHMLYSHEYSTHVHIHNDMHHSSLCLIFTDSSIVILFKTDNAFDIEILSID